MAWRIHHVAYVENLYPRRYSNLSTAFIRPMLPSWIRSRNCNRRFVYFFAMETTSRRLASISWRLGCIRPHFGLSATQVALDHSALRALQFGNGNSRVQLQLFKIGAAVLLL